MAMRMNWVFMFFFLLTACAAPAAAPTPSAPTAFPSPTAEPTRRAPTASPQPTFTAQAPTPQPTATLSPTPSPTAAPVMLIGAGDIASCGELADEHTAAIIQQYPQDAVFTAGDNTYENGTQIEYEQCYGASWGQFKDRTRPSAGNHDYNTGGAAYYAYFGASAGKEGEGYYSYNLGSWHIIVLNSNCNNVACGADSPQVQWLKADLAASSARCTMAIWHHPVFTSGPSGNSTWLKPFWQTLVPAGVDVVVNGHDHDYERFAPQDADGNPTPQGIREFIVGTGGAYQRPFLKTQPNSEIHQTGTFGVIRFALYADHYDWQFLPVDGQTWTDSGSAQCH